MQRVWGGRSLQSVYGRELPDPDLPFGESWEMVDREDEQSVVDGGEFDGLTLGELWTDHREAIFGGGEGERFPLMVKILDARDKLSIQVHPPAGIAEKFGGEPKTEMWYIADAEPGAELYVGLKAGVSKEDFVAGAKAGTTADEVHCINCTAGESIFIPSGRLHAIGAGLLIFEIQQNSDTTYRVFDWNRIGLEGKPRDLHVDESIECIDFDDVAPTMDLPDGEVLAECPEFKVERWDISGERGAVGAGEFSIVAVAEGRVRCGTTDFKPGDFFLVPANAEGAAAQLKPLDGSAVVLRTTVPR